MPHSVRDGEVGERLAVRVIEIFGRREGSALSTLREGFEILSLYYGFLYMN